MLEVSDLIYETCKTYLLNQGKFILMLWVCIAAVMVGYFGFLRGDERRGPRPHRPSRGSTEYSKAARSSSSWCSA